MPTKGYLFPRASPIVLTLKLVTHWDIPVLLSFGLAATG